MCLFQSDWAVAPRRACLRRSTFDWPKVDKGQLRRGISISPALIIHPLKTTNQGGLRAPPIGCTPRGWRLRNPQGEFPKMGEPQFPLFGRFQGGGAGGGKFGIPPPADSFAPFSSWRKGPAGGSSAQAADHSLCRKRQSSFPPLHLLSPPNPLRWASAGFVGG